MPGKSVRRVVAVGALGALTACAAMWSLEGHPGLLYKVKQYYEWNATEEAGLCTRPILEGVTRSATIAETEDELVLQLAYYYRDFVRDDDDCSELRPARCFILPECRGFAERTFTIARRGEVLEVVDMSGEKRRRPRFSPAGRHPP